MKAVAFVTMLCLSLTTLFAQERYEVRFEEGERLFAGTLDLYQAAATMQLEYFCGLSEAYESIQIDFYARRDPESTVELIAYRAVVPGTDVFHPTCPLLDFQLVYDAIGQPHLWLLDAGQRCRQECSIRPLPAPDAIMTAVQR